MDNPDSFDLPSVYHAQSPQGPGLNGKAPPPASHPPNLPRLYVVCFEDDEELLGPDAAFEAEDVVACGMAFDDEALTYQRGPEGGPEGGHGGLVTSSSPEQACKLLRYAFGPLRVVWL